MLIGEGTDQLEAHRQASGSETTGHGDCGHSCEVRWAISAKQQCAGGMLQVANADGFLTNERSRDRCGRDSQGVHARVGHDQMQLLDELFTHFECGQIDGRRDLGSQREAGSHVLAILSGAPRKTPGLLVVVSRFGPGDLISSIFSFTEQGQGELLDSDPLCTGGSQHFLEDKSNFVRNYIKEKFTRHAEREFERFSRTFPPRAQTRFTLYAREDCFEQKSCIADPASQRANAIKAWRKRNHTFHAYAAKSWL